MSRLPSKREDTALENGGMTRRLSQVQGKAADFAASMDQRAAGVAEQTITLMQHWSVSQLSVRSVPASSVRPMTVRKKLLHSM